MDATLTITDVVARGPRIENREPLWMFTLRSPASGRSVSVAFAPQAQAAIFEGHVLALAAVVGVPFQRIHYPRLQPAVLRIMQGRDRTERSRSPRRRSYYGFPEFDYELGMKGAHTARRARPTGSVAPLVLVPETATQAELKEPIGTGMARMMTGGPKDAR